ncbi:SGNH hydrolase domain-containing protein [Pelagibacteraceae bacterium]|nr:SGNH hydrolase domain-containing protein [Pelagibacteraceae bacterium]
MYSKNKKIILTNKSIYMNVYTANQFNPLDYYVYSNKKFPNKKKLKKLEKEVFKSLDQKKLNNILNDKAKKFGIQFLDMEEFQCNYKDKTCDLVTPDNYKIYWDRTHITEKGAKYLGNKIYELDWFMID